MKVQNKVIVVTGGGSGLGPELALNLLSKVAKVGATLTKLPCIETVRFAYG